MFSKAFTNFFVSQIAGIATPILFAIANGAPTGGALDYLNHHPILLAFYPVVQAAARELLNVVGVSKPASTSATTP